MNKFAKFMKKQGYYILLVLCVLLLATVITLSVVMTQRPADAPTANLPGGEEPDDPTLKPGDGEDPLAKTFLAPVSAAYTANYDTWVSFGMNGRQKHYGIDYEVAAGTKVVASYGGKVTAVETENGLTVLKISYDNGYNAVYRGLDASAKLENDVKLQANTPVTAGMHIGNIAAHAPVCGGCSEPHLHLEMYKGGETFSDRINPIDAFAESEK